MRYICTNCNYIYDESIGDIESWINIWTKIYEIWDDFSCPICNWSVDDFFELKEEVNYIEDNDNLSFDHFPYIEDNDWKILVKIWKDMHVMWDDHRIYSVLLYDEYWELIEEIFLDIEVEPIVKFDYWDLDEFEIRVRCSIHWLWWRKIKKF